jgi:hypothetical protein
MRDQRAAIRALDRYWTGMARVVAGLEAADRDVEG